MTTMTKVAAVRISPINMDERAHLGLRPGDTVCVSQKIEEKGKTRLQVFKGLVLARRHGNEPGATFTVRKVTGGIGVEKIFPLYSPTIDKIEIVKRAKVRRAKLYYIRDKAAKEIRRQMRRSMLVDIATQSESLQEEKRAKEATEATEADVTAAAEVKEVGAQKLDESKTEEKDTEMMSEEKTVEIKN